MIPRRMAVLTAVNLRTLGTLSVATRDGLPTELANRRLALALLALAATDGPEGVARDRALAVLWPDLDVARGRNNLKQLVFVLRRALGAEAIDTAGGAVRLAPGVFRVDLWELERAAADCRLTDAVDAYRGPFLDGFHIDGLHELDWWIEAQRERLARTHEGLLERLAAAARAAGDHEGAIHWRRRLATLDPLATRHAVGLIEALASAGLHAEALQHVQLHARFVRIELEADVAPEVRALEKRLREVAPQPPTARSRAAALPAAFDRELAAPIGPANSATGASIAAASTPPSAEAPAVEGTVATLVAPRSEPAERARPDRVTTDEWSRSFAQRPRRRETWTGISRRSRTLVAPFRIASLAVAISVASTGLTRWERTELTAAALDPTANVVAVMPFATTGAADSAATGGTVADLLRLALDGADGLDAVSRPRVTRAVQQLAASGSASDTELEARVASSVGASLYVSGSVAGTGGRLRVSALLHDRRAAALPPVRANAEGSADSLFDLVDQLAAQLLAARVDEIGGASLARVASVTTGSLAAAKSFFAAERHVSSGRFLAGLDALSDAVRIDSAFALAHFRLSGVADLLGDDSLAAVAAETAVRHSSRLSPQYRRLLDAYVARRRGDAVAAERGFSLLAADYPSDVQAWLGLGETLFHLNAWRGRTPLEARHAFERAARLDPANVRALAHLARIAALSGDSVAAAHWLRRAMDASSPEVVGRFALHVLGIGGPPSAGGIDRERLADASITTPGPTAAALLASTSELDLALFAEGLVGPTSAPDIAAFGRRLLAYSAAGHGRMSEARVHLADAAVGDPVAALEVRVALAEMSRVPRDSREIERLLRIARAVGPASAHTPDEPIDGPAHARAHPYLRRYHIALLSLLAGRPDSAEGEAASLERESSWLVTDLPRGPESAVAATLAASLRAHVALARGDSLAALALLERAGWERVATSSRTEAADRLLRADLLARYGRGDEALRWYASIGQLAPHELPYAPFARWSMAELLDRRGDRTAAARHYREVAHSWANADDPLRARSAEAARRARALEAVVRR